MAYGQDSLTEISRRRDQQQGGYRTPFGVMGGGQGAQDAPARSRTAAPAPSQSPSPSPNPFGLGSVSRVPQASDGDVSGRWSGAGRGSPAQQRGPMDPSPGNTPFPGGLAALQQRRSQEIGGGMGGGMGMAGGMSSGMGGGMSGGTDGGRNLPPQAAERARMVGRRRYGAQEMGQGGQPGGFPRPQIPRMEMSAPPSRYRTPFGVMGPGQGQGGPQGAPQGGPPPGFMTADVENTPRRELQPYGPGAGGFGGYGGGVGFQQDDPRARDQFLSMFRGGGGGFTGGGGY